MNKVEVLSQLSKRGLLKVKSEGRTIEYIEGDRVFYNNEFHNEINVFGVFHDLEDDIYEFFVTNNERGGMIDHYSDHETEDEAYTALYKYIEREDRIYNTK